MTAEEVIVQPHRRRLDRDRVLALQRTIRQQGMLGSSLGAAVAYRPSVGWVLLGGEHRWKAAMAPGSRTEVIVLRTWDDLVAWMAIDMTSSRRTAWDPVSAVHFLNKVTATLKPARGDRPADDVAEFVGIHRGILESVRWGMAVADDPDEDLDVREYVRSVLDDLERGGDGGHSVRDKVARYKARKAARTRPPESAALQRKAFGSIAGLEGTIEALLEMGPPNPDIPREELEEIAVRLGRLGPKLSKIKKNLRGER